MKITTIIFLGRNVTRLNKEYNNYKYNPIINANFSFIGGDKKFYLRYNVHIKKSIPEYPKINILGKKIINTTFQNKN